MTNTPLNPNAVEMAAKTILRAQGFDPDNSPRRERQDAQTLTAQTVRAYLAVAQPEVNSVEELDQLPVGSVVRGGEDDLIGEKIRFSPYLPHWCTTGEEEEADKRDLLPARVLYRPTEELTNGR